MKKLYGYIIDCDLNLFKIEQDKLIKFTDELAPLDIVSQVHNDDLEELIVELKSELGGKEYETTNNE